MVRLFYPRSRDIQSQETFLAPSIDDQTHNYAGADLGYVESVGLTNMFFVYNIY